MDRVCPFSLTLHGKRCTLVYNHKGDHELEEFPAFNEPPILTAQALFAALDEGERYIALGVRDDAGHDYEIFRWRKN